MSHQLVNSYLQAQTNTRLFFCKSDLLAAEKAYKMPFASWARLCEGVLLIEQTAKEDANYKKDLKNLQDNK